MARHRPELPGRHGAVTRRRQPLESSTSPTVAEPCRRGPSRSSPRPHSAHRGRRRRPARRHPRGSGSAHGALGGSHRVRRVHPGLAALARRRALAWRGRARTGRRARRRPPAAARGRRGASTSGPTSSPGPSPRTAPSSPTCTASACAPPWPSWGSRVGRRAARGSRHRARPGRHVADGGGGAARRRCAPLVRERRRRRPRRGHCPDGPRHGGPRRAAAEHLLDRTHRHPGRPASVHHCARRPRRRARPRAGRPARDTIRGRRDGGPVPSPPRSQRGPSPGHRGRPVTGNGAAPVTDGHPLDRCRVAHEPTGGSPASGWGPVWGPAIGWARPRRTPGPAPARRQIAVTATPAPASRRAPRPRPGERGPLQAYLSALVLAGAARRPDLGGRLRLPGPGGLDCRATSSPTCRATCSTAAPRPGGRCPG